MLCKAQLSLTDQMKLRRWPAENRLIFMYRRGIGGRFFYSNFDLLLVIADRATVDNPDMTDIGSMIDRASMRNV